MLKSWVSRSLLLAAPCCVISGWAVLDAVKADGVVGRGGVFVALYGSGDMSSLQQWGLHCGGWKPAEDPHLSLWALAACAS